MQATLDSAPDPHVGEYMKQYMIVLCGLIAIAWCSGCAHTRIVAHPPSEVVEVVQSLAPKADPPRYKTEEKIAGLEWSVVITEGIRGEKFKHYEIAFHIVAKGTNSTEITVDADLVDLLDRSSANRVARRYAEILGEALKKENPQPSSAGDSATRVAPEK